MRLKITHKDFLLILGIAVAGFIIIASIFYRDTLISNSPPSVSKKVQAAINPSVLVQKIFSAAKFIAQ